MGAGWSDLYYGRVIQIRDRPTVGGDCVRCARLGLHPPTPLSASGSDAGGCKPAVRPQACTRHGRYQHVIAARTGANSKSPDIGNTRRFGRQSSALSEAGGSSDHDDLQALRRPATGSPGPAAPGRSRLPRPLQESISRPYRVRPARLSALVRGARRRPPQHLPALRRALRPLDARRTALPAPTSTDTPTTSSPPGLSD
jgi:hypothetical protein